MSTLKLGMSLAARSISGISVFNMNATSVMIRSQKYVQAATPNVYLQVRLLSSQDITKNIQYVSAEKLNLETDVETLKLSKPREKPLCIMLNWMLAKQKHIHKYAEFYTNQGYDVLSVSCTPWQLLWPMKGSQLVMKDLLKFLEANYVHFDFMTIHGFSIGGYVFGEFLVHCSADKQRYMPILDKIKAQIWDSAADISEIQIGVPLAVFPKNKVMQNTLYKYIGYHMKTFHDAATIHYMRSSQQYHRTLVHAPALFLISKTDPVGSERSNRKVMESWISMGMKVTCKCWDKSPHVLHYRHHPKEYVEAMNNHLCSLGLFAEENSEKIRAKL